MRRDLSRWLVANEQVFYTEEEKEQLVNKPLDPQGAIITTDTTANTNTRIKALVSTRDLPENPEPGEGYQIGDVYWTWTNGRWMSLTGLYGH